MTRSYTRPDDLGKLIVAVLGFAWFCVVVAVGIAISFGGPGR